MDSKSAYRPRMVVRTIRDGRVKILGHLYEPQRESAERFNGHRAAFGLYWGSAEIGNYDERGLMLSCSLWGSEAAFKGEDDWPGPFIEDGRFKWEWWSRVDSNQQPSGTVSPTERVQTDAKAKP